MNPSAAAFEDSLRKTADICDSSDGEVSVVATLFRDYGGISVFAGQIATVKAHEDNALVREAIERPGLGRVLVVDGGGSLRCALLGGRLVALAHEQGWRGLIVFGCVRDAEEIRQVPIGVRALQTNPLRSPKIGAGQHDIPVRFGEVTFRPGEFVCADDDGIVVTRSPLHSVSMT
jgi:regulator of ribonuclease activity A